MLPRQIAILVVPLLFCSGCLPELTNPRCSSDSDCPVADGWCSCRDGLCFKFDCPQTVIPGDSATTGDGPDSRSNEACEGSLPGLVSDGCCPQSGDLSEDPDCVLARGQLPFALSELPLMVSAGGTRAWLTAATTDSVSVLVEVDTSGGEATSVVYPLGKTRARAPMILQDGRVAAIGIDGVVTSEAGSTPVTSISAPGVAGTPVQDTAGRLILVFDDGRVASLQDGVGLPGVAVPELAEVLTPNGVVFTAVVSGQPDTLAVVVEDGPAMLITLDDRKTVWASAGLALSAPPALGDPPSMVAVGGAAGVISAVQSGARTWDARVEFAGAFDLSPAIVGDTIILGAGKTLTAIRFVGEQATTQWTAELGGAISAAPLALDDGSVVVGLSNGDLVNVEPGDEAVVTWRFGFAAPAITPALVLEDGSLLHVTASGEIARIARAVSGAATWSRPRRDRGGIARTTP